MTNLVNAQHKNLVILRASDKDARRTSTSTLRTTFTGSTFATHKSGFLFAAICYLIASDRLLITVY